ncbi:flagellar export protein FliJ [Oceanobacillus sp. CAU 1775]
MAEIVSLIKVLNVRENEKNVAHKDFLKSQDVFEEVATKLYRVLKKKEEAEQSYENFIQTPTPLDKIKEQISYIEKLNTQITLLQRDVQFARSQMDKKQVILNEAYVEVKKFESIIEKRKQLEIEKTERMERSFMDEISINQYLSHKNR